MKRELRVQLFSRDAGWLSESQGRLHFTYDPDFLANTSAQALSSHFPLQAESFDGPEVDRWFGGLLPSGSTRKQIAKQLGLPERDTLGLLDRLGGDCAGGITFPAATQMQLFDDENQEIQWLNNQELQSILENLPRQPLLAGRSGLRATLPISASVIPVILKEEAVGLPCAGHLSTHILLRVGDRDTALRYIVAAALAGLMKLPCAPMLPRAAADEDFVLYARGDRINASAGTSALHLESLAQCALATEGQSPLPGSFERLRRQARPPAPALLALLDQVLFNTLIGNKLDASDWTLLDCRTEHCGLSPWMGFHLDDNEVALPWVDDKKRHKPASAAAWSSLADQAGLSRAQT